MGIQSTMARNTLAKANMVRDYVYFAPSLLKIARRLYSGDVFNPELESIAYAFNSSTIDLRLNIFPWAELRTTKAAIKLHTFLDLRGNIPAFNYITDGKVHDVNVLDLFVSEAGSFYIMDRAYLDFSTLYSMNQQLAFFVVRAKSNLKFRREYTPIPRTRRLSALLLVYLRQISTWTNSDA
jgi:hypothetical protein